MKLLPRPNKRRFFVKITVASCDCILLSLQSTTCWSPTYGGTAIPWKRSSVCSGRPPAKQTLPVHYPTVPSSPVTLQKRQRQRQTSVFPAEPRGQATKSLSTLAPSGIRTTTQKPQLKRLVQHLHRYTPVSAACVAGVSVRSFSITLHCTSQPG